MTCAELSMAPMPVAQNRERFTDRDMLANWSRFSYRPALEPATSATWKDSFNPYHLKQAVEYALIRLFGFWTLTELRRGEWIRVNRRVRLRIDQVRENESRENIDLGLLSGDKIPLR